jgi:hypothetical protein
LVQGKRIGVDASTMEASDALRTIVRREDGRTYREMLTQMAEESGIDTPSADDLVRLDRAPKARSCRTKSGRARPIQKTRSYAAADRGRNPEETVPVRGPICSSSTPSRP